MLFFVCTRKGGMEFVALTIFPLISSHDVYKLQTYSVQHDSRMIQHDESANVKVVCDLIVLPASSNVLGFQKKEMSLLASVLVAFSQNVSQPSRRK